MNNNYEFKINSKIGKKFAGENINHGIKNN